MYNVNVEHNKIKRKKGKKICCITHIQKLCNTVAKKREKSIAKKNGNEKRRELRNEDGESIYNTQTWKNV